MFSSRIQIGSYRVYSGRFFSDPDLFGSVLFGFGFIRVKKVLTQKVLINFRSGSRSGIFESVPVRIFGSRLKCAGLPETKAEFREGTSGSQQRFSY